MYNVTKDFCQINAVLLNFLFIKNNPENYHNFRNNY